MKLKLSGFFVMLLMFAGIFWSLISVNQINETERGILKRGGKMISIEQPGLKIVHYPLYTMDRLSVQQDTNRFDNVVSKTFDEQVVRSDVSVTYRLKSDDESVASFYKNFQTMDNFLDKILRRNITNQLQIVMGKYRIQDTVQKKEELDKKYMEYMINSLRDIPVEILSVQIESIRPSEQYIMAVEAIINADNEAKTRTKNLETENRSADIIRTRAQAEADREFIQRKAEADGIRAIGNAEAEAIEAKNKALFSGGNPMILIEYTKAVNWNGVQPSTVVSGSDNPQMIMDMRSKETSK